MRMNKVRIKDGAKSIEKRFHGKEYRLAHPCFQAHGDEGYYTIEVGKRFMVVLKSDVEIVKCA